MTDNEKPRPAGQAAQPVIFLQELGRDELEQEIARRTAGRFSTTVLRAALFPEHMGKMDQPDGYAGTQGECGDLMTFYLRIQGERIQKISFTTDGCDATIASGEMLASMVTGMALEQAEQVTPEDLLTALDGLPPNHVHCAALAVGTLREAIATCRGGGA
jgi:nitrogen fixation NifU-like protein